MSDLDTMDESLVLELDKYPHLRTYFTRYVESDGASENPNYLPCLIVWIRMAMDAAGTDPAAFFEMDEETAEDFYSWGHNSRWNNTFRSYLDSDYEFALRKCIELAQDYGDPEVKLPPEKE